jgi:hypothetical protein
MREQNGRDARGPNCDLVTYRGYASIIGDFSVRGKRVARDSMAVMLSSTAYNRADRSQLRIKSMEAERVNQIANLLSDLQQRAADLRRYL